MGVNSTPLLAITVLVASPFVGSFLALAADRLPAGRPWLTGRSRCDACDRTLGPADLVPVLSWLASGGRCRTCRADIPVALPLIELAAVGVALAAVAAAPGLWLLATAVLGWTLLLVAVLDIREYWLPLPILAALALLGLVIGFAAGEGTSAVLGLGAGFLLLEAVRLLYLRLSGREGLGGGDPLLLGAVSAWVGWQGIPAVLLLASIGATVAVLVASVVRGARPGRHDRVPLGAWIAAAGFLVWCVGPL